jgi:hypothetical protein
METITAVEAEARAVCNPAAPTSPRRRACAATAVAGLYVVLVLGAPLIIRYGPDLATSAPAAVAVREAAPRCASAPEFGASCQPRDMPAMHKALVVPLN